METLRDKWKGGRLGTLCAMEQAKVWALREVMKDTEEGVNYETIASKVVKIGPKGEKGGHPNRNAIRLLLEKIDLTRTTSGTRASAPKRTTGGPPTSRPRSGRRVGWT